MSELEFIRTLRQRFPASANVPVGIGDDGAVVRQEGDTVVVADMLLDKVHFDLSECSVEQAGRKAVTVNLSDLAAMGCRPVAAFVSIAVPRAQFEAGWLNELYDGIEGLCREFGFCVAGGDTNVWDGPFAVSVTMTGMAFRQPILRSSAEPGDRLFVTGSLGGSLESNRHLTFTPRVAKARQLADVGVHAMMDISDGLSIDLARMAEASQVGAVVLADAIPIHNDVPSNLPESDRLQRALCDGEDFELLVAIPPTATVPDSFGMTEIGFLTDGCEVRIRRTDGADELLPPHGWQHG